jgi:hypothetical protein
MLVNFQIGQCRITVDTDRTKKFYESLSRISENCECGDCAYFESEIIKKEIRLFKILQQMGVDLSRQPDIVPDGVISYGDNESFKNVYSGYYYVYGQVGKTQWKRQTMTMNGQIVSVDFSEAENDSFIEYNIIQESDEKLCVEFWLQCEKK